MTRVNDLIESSGFNDENADKQLLFLLSQYSDFHAKLGAIKEYNKLKKRISDKLVILNDAPIAQINLIPMSIPVRQTEEAEVVDAVTTNTTPDDIEENAQ